MLRAEALRGREARSRMAVLEAELQAVRTANGALEQEKGGAVAGAEREALSTGLLSDLFAFLC